uniref:(northern house mosquito) hypothetical protein n=2 Tax=Culex pipiens TaxID=7175 RepID=A0A8D8AYB4_CULPI
MLVMHVIDGPRRVFISWYLEHLVLVELNPALGVVLQRDCAGLPDRCRRRTAQHLHDLGRSFLAQTLVLRRGRRPKRVLTFAVVGLFDQYRQQVVIQPKRKLRVGSGAVLGEAYRVVLVITAECRDGAAVQIVGVGKIVEVYRQVLLHVVYIAVAEQRAAHYVPIYNQKVHD